VTKIPTAKTAPELILTNSPASMAWRYSCASKFHRKRNFFIVIKNLREVKAPPQRQIGQLSMHIPKKEPGPAAIRPARIAKSNGSNAGRYSGTERLRINLGIEHPNCPQFIRNPH